MRYVPEKARKAFATDLKTIYQAVDEKKALTALERVTEKWTVTIRNWAQVYGELSIVYEGYYQNNGKVKKTDGFSTHS